MITSVDKKLKKRYQKYGDLSPAAKSKLKLLLAGFVKSTEQKVSEATVKAFYYHDLKEKKLLSCKESNNSYVRKIMNLRFLSPKLIEDI